MPLRGFHQQTGILSIGSIHSGDAPNVIPAVCKFGGVSRAYSDEARKTISDQMYKIAEGIRHISDCDVDIYKYEGYPLRTHGGRKWLNGYSDHLPTIVYLRKH